MVDCLAQQCPSPISACQNSIHFQMTFCSCRFPQSPITILAPFLLCFLTILTYSSLLWPQLYLPYQQSANTLRVVIGPFSAFQAQIVCIQQALTPYFLSWRDWDLCAWLSFCRESAGPPLGTSSGIQRLKISPQSNRNDFLVGSRTWPMKLKVCAHQVASHPQISRCLF